MRLSPLLITSILLVNVGSFQVIGQSTSSSMFKQNHTILDSSDQYLVYFSKSLKKKGIADRMFNYVLEPAYDFIVLSGECNKVLVGSNGKQVNDGGGLFNSEYINLAIIDLETKDVEKVSNALRVSTTSPYIYRFDANTRVLVSENFDSYNMISICDSKLLFDKEYSAVSSKNTRYTYAFTYLGNNDYKYSIIDLSEGEELFESDKLPPGERHKIGEFPIINDVLFVYKEGIGYQVFDAKNNQTIGMDGYENIDVFKWKDRSYYYGLSGDNMSTVYNPVDKTFDLEKFKGRIEKVETNTNKKLLKLILTGGNTKLYDLETKDNLLTSPCDDFEMLKSTDRSQILCNLKVIEEGVQKMALFDAEARKFIIPFDTHTIEEVEGSTMKGKRFVRYIVKKDGKSIQYKNNGEMIKPSEWRRSNVDILDNYKLKKGKVPAKIPTKYKYRYKFIKENGYKQQLEIYLPSSKEVAYVAYNASIRGHAKKELIRVIEDIECETSCKEVTTCFTYDMKMVGKRYKCK